MRNLRRISRGLFAAEGVEEYATAAQQCSTASAVEDVLMGLAKPTAGPGVEPGSDPNDFPQSKTSKIPKVD